MPFVIGTGLFCLTLGLMVGIGVTLAMMGIAS